MSDFLAMGGHGFYIWASYGVTALFMIVEVIAVRRSTRTVEKRLARLARAEARSKNVQKD